MFYYSISTEEGTDLFFCRHRPVRCRSQHRDFFLRHRLRHAKRAVRAVDVPQIRRQPAIMVVVVTIVVVVLFLDAPGERKRIRPKFILEYLD